MNIQCIKIITGEDLVGDISEDMEGNITISEPLAVMMYPAREGDNKLTVGLIPYLIHANGKEFTFRKEHVLLRHEPALQLRNDYNRITGSGIVVAKPNLTLE